MSGSRSLALLLLASVLVACGNNASNQTGDLSMTTTPDDLPMSSNDLATTAAGDMATRPPDGMVQLQGAAAKGPLILGSPIDVSPTDSAGNPTGTIFQTSTAADGTFSVQMPPAPMVQIKANGYYYNEMTGQVSGSVLDLFALLSADNVGQMTNSVNLFTHLVWKRVKALLVSMSLATATAQAEMELRGQLRVGGNFDPGVPGAQMSMLGGDNDGAAWLFSLSAMFVRAAMIENGGPVEGVLQSLLNTVQSDVIAGGVVDATTLGYLARAQACVRPTDAMAKLAAYLTSIGSSAVVPNINRALDTDLDGVPNLTDSCMRIANPVSGGSQPAVTDQVCASSVAQSSAASVSGNTVITRSGDLDGNGAADVVAIAWSGTTAPTSLSAVAWLNPGVSLTAMPVVTDVASRLGLGGASIKLVQAQLGDLNGDGHADLALSYSATATSPTLAYLPGDGAGGFGNAVVIAAGVDPFLCGSGYCTSPSTPYCSGGTCVAGCGNDLPCPSGYSCVAHGSIDKICQQNCPTTPCGAGYVCVGGTTCAAQCGSNVCAPGQVCDYANGCKSDCGGKTCTNGVYCYAGACGGPGAAPCGAGPPCGPGYGCGTDPRTGVTECLKLCNGGLCQLPNGYCDPTSGCKPGCREQPPCPSGYTCFYQLGGGYVGCEPNCGTGWCSTGEICSSGACSCGTNGPYPNHFSCDPTQSTCVNGTQCLANNPCGPGGICPTAGDICVYGVCKPASFPGVLDFQLADIDGSGRLAVVGSGVPQRQGVNLLDPNRTPTLVVIAQPSAGVFAAPVTVPANAQIGTDAVDVRAADLTGDGRAEVLLSTVKGSIWGLQLLVNDGAGNFSPTAPAALAGPWSGRVSAALADVDGDGHRDVVISSGGGSVVTAELGDGAGSFGSELALTQTLSSAYLYTDCSDARPNAMSSSAGNGELAVGDANGDGKADLFVGAAIYLSTGSAFGLGGRIEGDLAAAASTATFAAGDPIITGPRLVDVEGSGRAALIDSHYVGAGLVLGVGRVNPTGVHTW